MTASGQSVCLVSLSATTMQCQCFAVVLVVVLVQVSGQCNLPPSLWCSSREAARLCQVEHQCERSGYLTPVSNPGPVNFTLYYESLCPDCQRFFRTQLFEAYQKIGQIMNITLVPYGNAFEKKDGNVWKFQCQHGPQECVGNLIEVCAIYYEKKIENYMPFIHCMETTSAMPEQSAKACAKQFPVAIDKILECSNSTLGNQLEHQMALKTDALSPPHQYVPWVTVNGVHTQKIEDEADTNLIKLICETYKGVKPPGCNQMEKESRCWRF